MKINFVTNNKNNKSGSYRIWIRDLAVTLSELGHDTKVHSRLLDVENDTDVIILCKSAYNLSAKAREMFTDKKIGSVNIPCDYIDKNIDFVIVGSLEEYVSMSSYDDVFIVPLIERKFINSKIKTHISKNNLRICFHGHYPHLFKFEPFIKHAIEKINKEIETTVVCITGHKEFKWNRGRPNVKIEMHDYNENFEEIVKSCDIGIVPNVSDIRLFSKDIQKITSVELGLYETDYFLRIKNKTNAGRAYVFYQLGIPVIHDLSPSSFELLSKTGYNICAHDEKSYYKEIKKLLNTDYRNKVAIKNNQVFKKHYDLKDHARNLINQISEIK
tara:strand:- start:8305 stop:9291 length:987 start_codon:yes stop_codon:yes gene_type:complete